MLLGTGRGDAWWQIFCLFNKPNQDFDPCRAGPTGQGGITDFARFRTDGAINKNKLTTPVVIVTTMVIIIPVVTNCNNNSTDNSSNSSNNNNSDTVGSTKLEHGSETFYGGVPSSWGWRTVIFQVSGYSCNIILYQYHGPIFLQNGCSTTIAVPCSTD